MVHIIQGSKRSLLSLSRTLIPHLRHRFPLHPNQTISKFAPIFSEYRFSASAQQNKSPFESNLIRILDNEIEFESDYAPPHQPDKKFNAFTVEERPGEQFVTLRGRSIIDENIKIEATMFDGYATVSPKTGDASSELAGQLHISLLVDISKREGGDVLEFVCSAWPDHLEIQKAYIHSHDRSRSPSRLYLGPNFRCLNKKLQNALYDFLKTRGVNNELSVFLHHYVQNKDKAELIRCLMLLKSYVEK